MVCKETIFNDNGDITKGVDCYMPYIKKERRGFILDMNYVDIGEIDGAGELNFAITSILDSYLGSNASYSDYNEVLGVLEAVKLELYRRRIAPYEDGKIKENGDVY